MRSRSSCGALSSALGALLMTSVLLAGCGDDDNNGDSSAPTDTSAESPADPANTAPVAAAGADQNVSTGARVTLDGSDSRDADGDMLDYRWTLTTRPDGSQASLSATDAAKPMFTADRDGRYVATLVVNDGQADSDADTVVVTAATANSAPVAEAGAEQRATAGQVVTLDGSASSDADSDPLTYTWALTGRPEGSTAQLNDAGTVRPSFTPSTAGTYVARLTVNDGQVDSAADTVRILVEAANSAPVADAGDDRDTVTGELVRLNGGDSRDADGDMLSYTWSFVSRPDGANAELVDADTVSPDFTPGVAGDYVVQLVVNDGAVDSEPDTAVITAAQANARPSAAAGDDQQVTVGDEVTLDASGSRDADGDELAYDWSFTSTPEASQVDLVGGDTVAPTFTPDVPGDYVLRLVVNDGQIDSAADTVTVTAAEANVAPTADAGADDNVATGVMVTLDGSASTDANGDTLTYDWRVVSLPQGSEATLVNATMAQPSFTPDVDGTYVFELVVSDGELESAPDRVQITAATPNSVPVADAGADQRVAVDESVTLDGSTSRDADNDALTYSWSFQSRPSSADAALTGADTATPSFTPDAAGDYVLQLVVSDGQADSEADTVRVTVVQPNLRFARQDFRGNFESSSLPTTIDGQSEISTSNPPCEIGRYRLSASNGDFTVTDLSATRTDGGSSAVGAPSFNGLSDGQVIRAGQSASFGLTLSPTQGRRIGVRYTFTIAETGDSFVADYQARCN